MSRNATPATRNEATRRLKPPKVTPFAELTAALTRTVADGCGRFGNVERTHPQPPDPQSETGTLATHSGKILKISKNTKCINNHKHMRHLSHSHIKPQCLKLPTKPIEHCHTLSTSPRHHAKTSQNISKHPRCVCSLRMMRLTLILRTEEKHGKAC